jgi:hypothetical protein
MLSPAHPGVAYPNVAPLNPIGSTTPHGCGSFFLRLHAGLSHSSVTIRSAPPARLLAPTEGSAGGTKLPPDRTWDSR